MVSVRPWCDRDSLEAWINQVAGGKKGMCIVEAARAEDIGRGVRCVEVRVFFFAWCFALRIGNWMLIIICMVVCVDHPPGLGPASRRRLRGSGA